MKSIINNKWAGVAFAAISLVGFTPSAKAILSLPDPLNGNAQYAGAINVKAAGLTEGAAYSITAGGLLSNGAAYAGSSTNANTGVTAVDALTQSAVVGSNATGSGLGNGKEDSFSVINVTSILGASAQTLYSGAGFQLVALSYGGQDVAVSVTGSPGAFTQTTSTVGEHVDLYQIPTATFNLATATPGQHLTLSSFMNLTIGGPILTTVAAAGVINGGVFNASTNPGGALTTFLNTFNSATGTGNTVAYLNVTGGTDAAQFNTNSQLGGTDIALAFTLSPGYAFFNPANGWTTALNDPATASVVIPEPSTVIAGLACLLPLMGAGIRRFKKS